jgi:hypothetical protein
MAPIAIGGLIVGLNLGGAGSQGGEVATHSSPHPSRSQTPQAGGKKPPSTGSPSKVVELSPITGDVIATSTSEASAAALQAVRNAVAAQAAAAAAAAQPGHH